MPLRYVASAAFLSSFASGGCSCDPLGELPADDGGSPSECSPRSALLDETTPSHPDRLYLAPSQLTARASSAESFIRRAPAQLAVDGDARTFWQPRGPLVNWDGELRREHEVDELVIALPKPHRLRAVDVELARNGHAIGDATGVQVFASLDKRCWEPVAEMVRPADDGVTVEIDGRVAQFLRVVITRDLGETPAVAEVSVAVEAGWRTLGPVLAIAGEPLSLPLPLPLENIGASASSSREGLTVDSSSRLLWTPSDVDIGRHQVTLSAETKELSTTTSMEIIVLGKQVVATHEFGPEGGTLVIPDDSATLAGLRVSIPANAFSDTTRARLVALDPIPDIDGQAFAVVSDSAPEEPFRVTHGLASDNALILNFASGEANRNEILSGELVATGNAAATIGAGDVAAATEARFVERTYENFFLQWHVSPESQAGDAEQTAALAKLDALGPALVRIRDAMRVGSCSPPMQPIRVVVSRQLSPGAGVDETTGHGLLLLSPSYLCQIETRVTFDFEAIIAHELAHIMQGGFREQRPDSETIMAESTAVFIEDEVFDDADDWQNRYGPSGWSRASGCALPYDPAPTNLWPNVVTDPREAHSQISYRHVMLMKYLASNAGLDVCGWIQTWTPAVPKTWALLDGVVTGDLVEHLVDFGAAYKLWNDESLIEELSTVLPGSGPVIELTQENPCETIFHYLESGYVAEIRVPPSSPKLHVKLEPPSNPIRGKLYADRRIDSELVDISGNTRALSIDSPRESTYLSLVDATLDDNSTSQSIEIELCLYETTSLSGTVVDQNDKRWNAQIEVTLEQHPDFSMTGYADMSGFAYIDRVPADLGPVTVRASCGGESAEVTVDPVADQVTNFGTLRIPAACGFVCASLGDDWVACPQSGQCAHQDWFCDQIAGEFHCPNDVDEVASGDGYSCPDNARLPGRGNDE